MLKNVLIGRREGKVPSKFNIFAVLEDENLSIEEGAELMGISKTTLGRYMREGCSKGVADVIETFIFDNVENPEDYLFENRPYTPHRGGRKKGSKNKASKVIHISKEEYAKEKAEEIKAAEIKMKTPNVMKIQLKDFEEISEALINGETVYQENSPYSLKITNKFLMRYSNNKPIFMSPSIDLKESYYVLRAEKLPLQVGKTYYTKNKTEIVIFSYDENMEIFKGIALGSLNNWSYLYNEEGKLVDEHLQITNDDPYEIIGEKL